ncbi:MAG: helicase HerA-like domain-containing protein [Alphaproteobacteria bacterium]
MPRAGRVRVARVAAGRAPGAMAQAIERGRRRRGADRPGAAGDGPINRPAAVRADGGWASPRAARPAPEWRQERRPGRGRRRLQGRRQRRRQGRRRFRPRERQPDRPGDRAPDRPAARNAPPERQYSYGRQARRHAGDDDGWGAKPARASNRQSVGEAFAKSLARSAGSQIGRQVMRGLLGSIFGR